MVGVWAAHLHTHQESSQEPGLGQTRVGFGAMHWLENAFAMDRYGQPMDPHSKALSHACLLLSSPL